MNYAEMNELRLILLRALTYAEVDYEIALKDCGENDFITKSRKGDLEKFNRGMEIIDNAISDYNFNVWPEKGAAG